MSIDICNLSRSTEDATEMADPLNGHRNILGFRAFGS